MHLLFHSQLVHIWWVFFLAHLFRSPSFDYPNKSIFISDVYGLRGRRTSKFSFLFFSSICRMFYGLAYLFFFSFFFFTLEKKAVDFIKEDYVWKGFIVSAQYCRTLAMFFFLCCLVRTFIYTLYICLSTQYCLALPSLVTCMTISIILSLSELFSNHSFHLFHNFAETAGWSVMSVLWETLAPRVLFFHTSNAVALATAHSRFRHMQDFQPDHTTIRASFSAEHKYGTSNTSQGLLPLLRPDQPTRVFHLVKQINRNITKSNVG